MPDRPPEPQPRNLAALRIPREEPAARRRWPPAWVVAAAVALGAVAVGWPLGTRWLRGAAEVATDTVRLERPPTGAEAVLVSSGYVVARTKASISAKIPGRLELVAVDEGTPVVEGDLIARLENDDLEAAVEAESAAVSEAEATLARASSERDLAIVDRNRQRRLLEAEVGNAAARDAAEAQARAAEARVREAEAAVRSARARLARADVDLANADVRAPFSGVILRKEAEVGESVAPAVASGQLTRGAIVTMADLSDLEVETDVAEGSISRIAAGTHAEIALDAVADRRYRGRVRQVLPTADRQKATVEVDVTILDADERVKPEMSARVTFLSAEPDAKALAAAPVLTVAASAVPAGASEAHAFVVRDGVAVRVSVTVGERRGDRLVVTSGLAAGEVVVLSPPERLADGDRVRVKEPT